MAASYADSSQDEGYSEDPLTLEGSANVPRWLSSMPTHEKTEYVMSIIDQLPTSRVVEIVRRLRPRLYFNFINHLPVEVCLKILGFLDPVSLINTALTSREWLLLSTDRKLWRQLYLMEGFRVLPEEIRLFEANLNVLNHLNSERSRPSKDMDEEHASKRRATPQHILSGLQADMDTEMVDVEMPGAQPNSLFGGDFLKQEPASMSTGMDTPMLSPTASSRSYSAQLLKKSNSASWGTENRRASSASALSIAGAFPTSSSLVMIDQNDMKRKLNWQYLYSQRRRLEANWESEKYTNFQLPHPQHPEEAHKECIYTIQYTGKYLVSGSRDRTLRIWDLDTRRLAKVPLSGHDGSVLCLQFDASPEEDLIVSGSSDSSVILWKFSTGRMIQRIRNAHRESVLNVRFDKRILVTCSKDKTIKVFNRQPLRPGEPGYPLESPEVNPVPTILNNYGFDLSPSAELKPAYSIIACLDGHGAAVNAVQIQGDEVVSASGDRTLKLWNWVDQACVRTLIGHSKGIACVQYDGRRIVSGSSDNEVKVFDKETGLEVASLRAHTSLVRTVQAGFGDLPYSELEDKKHAKAIDHDYFRAVASGEVSRTNPPRGRTRNAGSSKPEDITAYGAKLPPGGGGGKYGRIVSGSYDETIIIWRRDKEGLWKAQHVLRQEDAADAAARAGRRRQPVAQSIPTQQTAPQPQIPNLQPQAHIQQQQALAQQQQPSTFNTGNFPPAAADALLIQINQAMAQGQARLAHFLQSNAQIIINGQLRIALMRLTPDQRAVMLAAVSQVIGLIAIPGQSAQNPAVNSVTRTHASMNQSNAGPSSVPAAAPADTTQNLFDNLFANTAAGTPAQQIIQHFQQNAIAPAAAPLPPAPQPAPQFHGQGPLHHQQTNMFRVFKLQFDARRIICCSQTSTIVGWDFANNDEQIIEASRFFAPIE